MKRSIPLVRHLCIALLVLATSGCVNTLTQSGDGVDARSTQLKWQDSTIEFEAAALNNKAPFKGDVRVTASVYDGKAVLFGQARTAALSQQFEQKVSEIPNVTLVHNQIRIKAPLPIPAQTQDTWITTKVKSAFAEEPLLKGNKIKVVTEDKEVFLLGFVSPETADLATNVARNVGDVEQVIRAFNLQK